MSGPRGSVRIVGALLLAGVAASASPPVMQGIAPRAVLERFDVRRSAAVQAKLPNALREISGLATTADGRVFVHGDERAIVAQIDGCAASVTKSFSLGNPPVRGDFEGIAVAGERFFLITSTGLLYEFREGADAAVVPFTVVDTGFGKVCELEGLAYDGSERVLLVGCKNSVRPELRGQLAILRWSLERRAPALPPSLTTSLKGVLKLSGTKGFHITSIERDARTGDFVLVAGPERSIVELAAKGGVLAARSLQRQLHSQPEGVTIVGDSVLLIADEGGAGRGAITCYPRVR